MQWVTKWIDQGQQNPSPNHLLPAIDNLHYDLSRHVATSLTDVTKLSCSACNLNFVLNHADGDF